jgi:hypothetical protein
MRLSATLLALVVATSAIGVASSAQYSIPNVRDLDARSGAPVLVVMFFDCKSHVPYEGSAFVQHGKITKKRVTINRCGNPKEPAIAYWYTSDPKFKGLDEANFSLVSGSAFIAHITVR